MIEVHYKTNPQGEIVSFNVTGHAGFAQAGEDIVCSAVSILVINTVNCLYQLTDVPIDVSEKDGMISCCLSTGDQTQKPWHDAQLLVKAMMLGLKDVQKQYLEYIKIYEEG